jgi:ketose-bisphosphate aldolase
MIVSNLTPVLEDAMHNAYGVGAFSPRSTFLVEYVLKAAQRCNSPVIVQMSANEFNWFNITAAQFAEAFYRVRDQFTIPAVLHLDHTKDLKIIQEAIDAGFTSVMIDASHLPYEENIRITREAVAMARLRNVSVEAELGSIGGADKLETDHDETLYTNPQQAREFVEATGVNALAVSIGTAHGLYIVKNPTIDFARLRQIRGLMNIPLVLHGGSGLPAETVNQAIKLDGMGGVSKINIATDLEMTFREALGGMPRMTNQEINALPLDVLQMAGKAVSLLVEEKIKTYVLSCNRA